MSVRKKKKKRGGSLLCLNACNFTAGAPITGQNVLCREQLIVWWGPAASHSHEGEGGLQLIHSRIPRNAQLHSSPRALHLPRASRAPRHHFRQIRARSVLWWGRARRSAAGAVSSRAHSVSQQRAFPYLTHSNRPRILLLQSPSEARDSNYSRRRVQLVSACRAFHKPKAKGSSSAKRFHQTDFWKYQLACGLYTHTHTQKNRINKGSKCSWSLEGLSDGQFQ